MGNSWLKLRVVLLVAFRNLWSNRLKTVIAGSIVFSGAFLVVLGSSIAQTIDRGMSRSIVDSIAGDIQVSSAHSKDELELIDTTTFEGPDLAEFDYARLREVLSSVPNIRSVVPMAIGGAAVPSPNSIDVALEQVRDSVQAGTGAPGGTDPAAYAAQKDQIRQIVSFLREDTPGAHRLSVEGANTLQDRSALERAVSPEFWQKFDEDPLANLDFLENRVAPQVPDSDMLFLRYVGTDPTAFARAFPRMRIVDGTGIPPGKRGFLYSKSSYEDQLKLKIARRLDKIKQARDERGSTIRQSSELTRFVHENTTQLREILLQLDSTRANALASRLRAKLSSQKLELRELLAEFLAMNDANFDDRYRFFYAEIAPSLQLYRLRVGDTLAIKSFTKAGYLASVSLRIYGTFEFAGLERSPLAAHVDLMDLVSFRELAGWLNTEQDSEIVELRAKMGVAAVAREDIESNLFATRAPVTPADEAQAAPAEPEAPREPASNASTRRAALANRPYDVAQLGRGLVLNAAVFLSDPSKLQETRAAIERAGRDAGLPLRAIPWQKAAGLVGQFVTTMEAVLYTCMLVIFLVSLVIINNALVMATLERVPEIGTLRAIGAQPSFIVAMIVVEALVQGVVFGALGAAAGALLVAFLGDAGIPAANDMYYFFFSGPKLYPSLATDNLVGALLLVLLVSVLSALYPAYLAMKVTPRQAMQGAE
jgi:ABC-type lipoprotein release transport system permease subunit